MPRFGPYTDSDLAEEDDFVRAQLLLSNALELGFACDADPPTVFRDDLLGLGLLSVEPPAGWHDGPFIMLAVCHREQDHGQWRVLEFVPAHLNRSSWISYGRIGSPELGVAVTKVTPDNVRNEGNDAILLTVAGRTYRVQWDVPGPA